MCKFCDGTNHSSLTCFKRPKNRMNTTKPLVSKKRIKPMGKVGKALAEQRAQFLEENAPPYLCIYCLVIGIDFPLLPEEFDVEHGQSKSKHPGLRFYKKNLFVGCKFHNQEKAGMDMDEYIDKLKKQMEDL